MSDPRLAPTPAEPPRSRWVVVLEFLRRRPELLALPVVLLVVEIVPPLLLHGAVVPGPVYLLGLAAGAPLAMQAIGILIVYRANGILNFAQATFGGVAALLFYNLITHKTWIVLAGAVCGCLPAQPEFAPFGMQLANFLLSIVAGLLLGPALAFLAYAAIIRRFEQSPPLVMTVVTVGLSSLLLTLAFNLIKVPFPDTAQAVRFSIPVDLILTVHAPANLFSGPDLPLAIAGPPLVAIFLMVVVGLALAAFFRYTRMGVALRASADNPNRARTLGVNVNLMSSISWAMAGGLSALAALLQVAGGQATQVGALGGTTLVRMLTVVVIARLSSIPLAIVAGLFLGVVEQSLSWSLQTEGIFDAGLLFIILFFLLIRSEKFGRTRQEAASVWRATFEVRPMPTVMRSVPVVRRYLVLGAVLAAVVVLAAPWVATPGQVSQFSVDMMLIMVGLSLLVLTGWAGQVSLGQLGLAGVGAYVAALLASRLGAPFILCLPAGALAGALAAALIGLPSLRLPGLNLAVVTLAFGASVVEILFNPAYLGSALGGQLDRPGFLGLDANDDRVFYYMTLAFLVVVMFLVMGLRKSRTARALIAARDNGFAAQSLGINLFRARLQAFTISGSIAGFAGALMVFQEHGVRAASYSLDQSLNLFLTTIIGGLGTVWGPVIGKVYLIIADASGIVLLALFAVGGGSVFLLMFYPAGLSGVVFGIRDALLRRVAQRYRIDAPSLLSETPGSLADQRVPIAPNVKRGGGSVFVPVEYRLRSQWSLPAEPQPEGVQP